MYETAFELVAQRASPVRSKIEGTVKVVGWEDVVVPAGKFRALKVEAKGTIQRLDAAWSGWNRYDVLYVPEVKRWVKSTYEEGVRGSSPYTKQELELVEFKVQ